MNFETVHLGIRIINKTYLKVTIILKTLNSSESHLPDIAKHEIKSELIL